MVYTLSSRVSKYQLIIDKKLKKHGSCKSIMISEIANKKSVILLQNSFVRVADNLRNEILENFNLLLVLKRQGVNLFFADCS